MSDFDDVYIVPQYSEIERGQIDLTADFFGRILQVPILSSPMDTVTGIPMMVAMRENGGYGIHHRYCSYAELDGAAYHGGIAVSPSMDFNDIQTIMMNSASKIVVLDVAHGHTKRNLDFCKELIRFGYNVVSGNICTSEAAEAYLNIGVNYLRVGIGSGSVCTTRMVTGVGVPNSIAIPSIKEALGDDVHIISDGGHKTTGDIAKAFALGAEFVMLGRMLASTEESICGIEAHKRFPAYTPSILWGEYSGMASADALVRNGKKEFFVEGEADNVEINTTVAKLMKQIKDALETTCYYTGSHNLKELYGNYGMS